MGQEKWIALAGAAFAAALASGCGESGSEARTSAAGKSGTAMQAAPVAASAEPWYTSAQVREGRDIYKEYCASCHGGMGQGARNWRQRGPDGSFPAPPLNGSGHTWHHPLPALEQIIREGGPGNMPAWGQRLSDAQIRAVLAYVQSLWPERIYGAWAQRVEGQS